MTKLVWALIDKLVFFATALVGMQVPMWLVQYQQRLGGQLDEASLHLGRYQVIADTHTDGDLMTLVTQFRSAADPATREAGHVIWQLHDRVQELSQQAGLLSESNVFQQLMHLSRHLNMDLARSTMDSFQPGLLLNLDALLLAVTCGLLVSGLLYSMRATLKWCYERLHYRRMPRTRQR